MAELSRQVQPATGDAVDVAFVNRWDMGDDPAADAQAHGIKLEVVKLPEASGPKKAAWCRPRRLFVEQPVP